VQHHPHSTHAPGVAAGGQLGGALARSCQPFRHHHQHLARHPPCTNAACAHDCTGTVSAAAERTATLARCSSGARSKAQHDARRGGGSSRSSLSITRGCLRLRVCAAGVSTQSRRRRRSWCDMPHTLACHRLAAEAGPTQPTPVSDGCGCRRSPAGLQPAAWYRPSSSGCPARRAAV
jgi:hypothetical protein